MASILLSVAPATAAASTQVRFLHAVPGGPTAKLKLASDRVPVVDLPPGSFGKATDFGTVAPGSVKLTLTAGGKRLGATSKRLNDGAKYTVVAVAEGKKVRLLTFRDGTAQPGKARWRMIHAAPEIGTSSVSVDNKDYGKLERYAATPYRTTAAGDHKLALGEQSSGSALVSSNENLVAGTSDSAYVIGSGGEKTQFVVLQDDAATPSQAPATGMGGLTAGGSGDTPWLAMTLAALVAALVGAGIQMRLRAHSRARS